LHGAIPRTNTAYWQQKLEANIARDRRNDVLLTEAGWTVVRVWEHEDIEDAAELIQKIVLAKSS
jgi:DNA mismatch endonuclease (patch repair protein)